MNAVIREDEALVILTQIWSAQVFTFYSMFFAICIGLLAVPLFALNVSLTANPGFTLVPRLIFFAVTLLLADGAFYCISKTIYSSALLAEMLHRFKIAGKEKSSMDYLGEIKVGLRNEFSALRLYKMRDRVRRTARNRLYKLQILASIIVSSVGVAILFSFVWWDHNPFLSFLLVSESIYLLSLYVLLRYIHIM